MATDFQIIFKKRKNYDEISNKESLFIGYGGKCFCNVRCSICGKKAETRCVRT